MTDRNKIIEAILRERMIVIMRGLDHSELINTVAAMEKGGVKLVEVTFDQSGRISDRETADNIAALVREFEGRVLVGAGTVMTIEQLDLARDAGAGFIISPDSCEEIIRGTVERGLVSIPGAFTPTECANAHRWGADFIKLFPNSEVRPSYLKALKAPLSNIRFLAVGGINLENLGAYMAAGASGIGLSSNIVDMKAIKSGDYAAVTAKARAYTEEIRKYGN